MNRKHSDFRWASPHALKNPSGPTPFLSRREIQDLKQWINDPESNVWVPVNLDGEIIGEEFVGIVRVLRSLDVAAVVTWVVHIEDVQDMDYFSGVGVDLGDAAGTPAATAVQNNGCAIGAEQAPLMSPWWIDEAPPPFAGGPTIVRWSDVFDGEASS